MWKKWDNSEDTSFSSPIGRQDTFRYILLEFNACIFLSSGNEIILYELIPTILLQLNIYWSFLINTFFMPFACIPENVYFLIYLISSY